MRHVRLPFGLVVASVALVTVSSAWAGGYYSGNRGAHATGRAGAVVAKPDDLAAVIYNPAGLAGLGTTVLQGANRFVLSSQEFTRAPTLDYGSSLQPTPTVRFDPVTSEGLRALDPFVAIGSNFGLRDWGFAFAAYAPPGKAGTEFPVNGGSRYQVVSSEVVMFNYALSAGYRFSETFAVGVSLEAVTLPSLKYQTVVNPSPFPQTAQPVSSILDMLATVEVADSFTPNVTLGVWGRPFSWLEFGASGQILPADIVARGKLSIEPVEPIPGSDGVELFRIDPQTGEELAPRPVELTLPLPLIARGGVRFIYGTEARERFDVELDVVYEGWSRVRQLHLATHGLQARYGIDLEISDIDLPKHWQDTLAVQLGSEVNVVPERLKLRAGVSYETPTAAPAYATVDSPAGAQMATTLGASLYWGGFEIGVALEYRRVAPVTVSEQEGRVYQTAPSSACKPPYTDGTSCHPSLIAGKQPAPTVNAGAYQSSTLGATIELAYRF